MAVRFNKPWQALTRENVSGWRVTWVFISWLTDGRSDIHRCCRRLEPVGLRGELESHLSDTAQGSNNSVLRLRRPTTVASESWCRFI